VNVKVPEQEATAWFKTARLSGDFAETLKPVSVLRKADKTKPGHD
jgi:hypothetical protein